MSHPIPRRSPDPDPVTWDGTEQLTLHRDLAGRTVGDFEVERLLGRGGMGEVYLARQISLNRPVALKILRADLANNPAYLSRFEVEATAVARLNHPNIVQVYTLGKEGDLRFIAMEYVQGTNLKDYLVKKGTVDLALGLSIMRQAAQAIAAAGEIGLIHRDIKPENLLLTRKGQLKVADFGLCREQGSDALHLTQEGVTLGTPMYMSPEQVQGKALDHRSDLYSMGVTFYHMFAGVTPFRGDSAIAVALKHVKETPISLEVHRPDLPDSLVETVMKLLEKSPANRPQTAKDLLREIQKIRDSASSPAVKTAETIPLSQASLPTTTEAISTPRKPRVPLRVRLQGVKLGKGAMALLAMGGLVLGGLIGWLGRSPDLMAANTPVADSPPGLWLEPGWKSIPGQAGPREQLRYAQLEAAPNDRAAAYLAVPGNFPTRTDWAITAYIHLARNYLANANVDGLRGLARSLADGQPESLKQLSTLAEAGADALSDRAAEARDRLTSVNNLSYLDPPGLAELALEVVEIARTSRSGSSMSGDPWTNLRNDSLQALGIEPGDTNDQPRRAADRP